MIIFNLMPLRFEMDSKLQRLFKEWLVGHNMKRKHFYTLIRSEWLVYTNNKTDLLDVRYVVELTSSEAMVMKRLYRELGFKSFKRGVSS